MYGHRENDLLLMYSVLGYSCLGGLVLSNDLNYACFALILDYFVKVGRLYKCAVSFSNVVWQPNLIQFKYLIE
jgi:hypothetical protein